MEPAETQFYNLAKELFKKIPAYQRFLNSKGIRSSKDFPDRFDKIPIISKTDYIEKFPIEDRLNRGKKLSDYYMICTSSGSTGEPTIWPRDYESDKRAIDFNYQMYQQLFKVDKKRTLVVVTFGLGAWTAGMLTSRLCWEMPKSAKISVVTPGLDKEVALRVIKQLSKYFDQTIITGYPPFLTDLIDFGSKNNFDFKKINTKIHFTSARLLESQRLGLAKLISSKNAAKDVLGFYASSEAGIIGIETPETVDLLGLAAKNKKFCEDLFNSPTPPSFITYNPKVRYLEEHKGRILISVNQPVPLLRYDTKDRGGIFDGRFLSEVCRKFGYSIPETLADKNFAYIFGRTDSVRLLSNIYVDDILYCLSKSGISKKLTNNFKYGLGEAGLRNELKMIVYLKKGKNVSKTEQKLFVRKLIEDLSVINPDFKMVSSGINFKFNIAFSEEGDLVYKGGKFDYHL